MPLVPAAVGNAAMNSLTEANRVCRILFQRPGDHAAIRLGHAARLGSAVRCFISTSPTLSPSNGTRPVSIS